MALTTRQLCEAVSIDIGATCLELRELRDIHEILFNCSSLVRLSDDGSSLESAHFTVEEYVRSIDPATKPHLSRFLWTTTRADTYMSEVCLTALNFDRFDINLISDDNLACNQLHKFPFYMHAIRFGCYDNIDYSSAAFIKLTERLFCSPNRKNFGNWRQLFIYHWAQGEEHLLWRLCRSIQMGMNQSKPDVQDFLLASSEEGLSDHRSAWYRSHGISSKSSELHLAAMLRLTHLLESLVRQTCQVNFHGSLGTPLHCALAHGELLLSVFADRDLSMVQFRNTVAEDSFQRQLKPTLRALVSLGADVNIDFSPFAQRKWTTPLLAFHVGELNELLRAGAVLDAEVANLLMRDTTSLGELGTCLDKIDISLVSESDRPVVTKLLEHVKQPRHREAPEAHPISAVGEVERQELFHRYEEAVWDACWADDLHNFQWILEVTGISVDHPIRGDSFLGLACEAESPKVIEYLLKHGAGVNIIGVTQDREGLAPSGRLFHNLAMFDATSLRVLHLLVSNNASLSSATANGDSILMCWASIKMHDDTDMNPLKDALELLLTRESNVNRCNKDGQCVWHILAKNPKGDRLTRLLASCLELGIAKTGVNLLDSRSQTPLHIAFSHGHHDMILALLNMGSEPSIRAVGEKTILHLAAGSLTISTIPLQLALDAGWNSDDLAKDFRDAIHECIAKALCANQEWVTPHMPIRLRDTIVKLADVSTVDRVFDGHHVRYLTLLADWLSEHHHHNCGFGTCIVCTTRLECFGVILCELQESWTLSVSDFLWFETLCKSLVNPKSKKRPESACCEAILAVLVSKVPLPILQQVVCQSNLLEHATLIGSEKLLHALLGLDMDVDKQCSKKGRLSFLQLLCRDGAPGSVAKKALARTKDVKVVTRDGDTLLHLCFRSKKTSVIPQLATVELLVGRNIDLHKRSARDGLTALMGSAKQSSTEILELLLRHGADVTIRDSKGRNALNYASERGAHECISVLVKHECPVVFSSKMVSLMSPEISFWCGPLQGAAYSGSLRSIQALGHANDDAEHMKTEPRAPTALWVACGTKKANTDLSIVRYLIAQGAELDYQEPSTGTAPLHVAAALGYLKCVEVLLDAGSDPTMKDLQGLTARMHALARGHHMIDEILASEHGVRSKTSVMGNAEQYRSERFCLVDTLPDVFGDIVAAGNLKAFETMNLGSDGLDFSMPYQSCSCNPMNTALYWGQTAIAGYLQELGIRARETYCSRHPASRFPALGLMAARWDMLHLAEVMMKTGTKPSPAQLYYSAHVAAAYGHVGTLKMLLAAGCPLERPEDTSQLYRVGIPLWTEWQWDSASYIGGSLIHTAIAWHQGKILDALLTSKIDLDAQDDLGQTALHIAAASNNVSALMTLMPNGIDVDVRSADMSTPLIAAARGNCLHAIQYLLDHGADIHLKGADGSTACVAAALGRYPESFLLLKAAGSDVTLPGIFALYTSGMRTLLMMDDFAQRILDVRGFWTCNNVFLMKPILLVAPQHQRRYNLTRFSDQGQNVLYEAAAAGNSDLIKLLSEAGGMVNLEGGPEGTPLMVACKFGRLDVVKYLVRNNATMSYMKHGEIISAFAKACMHPRVQRWLLVGRYVEQRNLVGGLFGASLEPDAGSSGIRDFALESSTDRRIEANIDLVFREDLESYLRSKNCFLPRRRFFDRGDGTFVSLLIDNASTSTDVQILLQQQSLAYFCLRDTLPYTIHDFIAEGDLQQLKKFVAAGGDLSLRFESCECTPVIAALEHSQKEIVEYMESLGLHLIGNACARQGCKRLSALDLLAAEGCLLAPLQRVLRDPRYTITSQDFIRMLHSATFNGNVEALKLILAVHRAPQHLLLHQDRNALIYRQGHHGRRPLVEAKGTVLHTAVQAGSRESVELLLPYYPNPDILGLDGKTPSHIAAQRGRGDLLTLLLSHGGSVEARCRNMRTPLFAATEDGHIHVIQMLLEHGADLTVVDDYGQTLFDAAMCRKDLRTFVFLWYAGLSISAQDMYYLHWRRFRPAFMMSNTLDRLINSPIQIFPPLDIPSDRSVLKIIPAHYRKLSLTSRLWIDGPTVIYRAAIAGYLDLVVMLLEAGSMINQEGGPEGTPLMGACMAGRLNVVSYLVRNGAVVEYKRNGTQVSAFAKAKSHLQIQRWLLVERFTEQPMVLDGSSHTSGEQPQTTEHLGQQLGYARDLGDTAIPTKDLVLEANLELYLESVNWFLPARRFVDRGDGGFDLMPIARADFSRYRPDNYPRDLAGCHKPW